MSGNSIIWKVSRDLADQAVECSGNVPHFYWGRGRVRARISTGTHAVVIEVSRGVPQSVQAYPITVSRLDQLIYHSTILRSIFWISALHLGVLVPPGVRDEISGGT
jgi:hypothetical protein